MRSAVFVLLLSSSAFGQLPSRLELDSGLGNPISARPQQGIETSDEQELPPDLGRSIPELQQLRIQTAIDVAKAAEARFNGGLESINTVMAAQIELALAQIDATNNKSEQLRIIEAGLKSATRQWQRVDKMSKFGGIRGGTATVAKALNTVYRFKNLARENEGGRKHWSIAPTCS